MTIGKLALFRIEQLELTIPTLALQEKYLELTEKIDAQRAVARRAATESEALFASLQSRAFRGEL